MSRGRLASRTPELIASRVHLDECRTTPFGVPAHLIFTPPPRHNAFIRRDELDKVSSDSRPR